jgi:fucose permease
LNQSKSKSRVLLIALAYLGFISLGLPDGLLGVAWPSIRAYFDLPLDALGSLLVMFTIGYLISSFTSGRILARMNIGMLLALSCLATAASLLGYALAPYWWTMVSLAVVAGLGAGAIDAGLNTFAAVRFTPRMVNWLHASYGLGATTGPVIITSVMMGGGFWQWGYAIVGGWQALLAVCFFVTRRKWPANQVESPSAKIESAAISSTLRLPVAWLSIAIFFVYTGLEAAAGVWPYSLFTEARGIPMSSAGFWVSAYWGSFTIGRIVSGIVAGLVSVQKMIRICIIGIIIGAALIWSNFSEIMSFHGIGLMGLSSAPIFPTLIATTPQRLSSEHIANAVGFQISAAVLGQSLLPAFIGGLASRAGLEIIGLAFLGVAIILMAIYELLAASSAIKRRDQATPADSTFQTSKELSF